MGLAQEIDSESHDKPVTLPLLGSHRDLDSGPQQEPDSDGLCSKPDDEKENESEQWQIPFVPESAVRANESSFDPCPEQTIELHGELPEIDADLDPPQNPPGPISECGYASLSRLGVREHVKADGEALKRGVREVLDQMEAPPEKFTSETVATDEAFLDSVGDRILNSEEFVAGSFQNSYPAWEELLRNSKRQ